MRSPGVMTSPNATRSPVGPSRVLLPPPPTRARPVATPVATLTVVGLASAVCGLVLGVGWVGVLATTVVTALAVAVGWAVDRLAGELLTTRRERSRFEAALDEVAETVAGLRAARSRELAEWYPTSERVRPPDAARPAPRALVLGVGRASSGLVLEGRPDDHLDPDDPFRARLAQLRDEAATLDEAPLCVPLATTVRVVGPPVVAESVAAGLRRQLRAAGAPRAEATEAVECVVVEPPVASTGPAADELRTVDTVLLMGPDGEAVVTLADGRPCRQSLRVAFVSVLDG